MSVMKKILNAINDFANLLRICCVITLIVSSLVLFSQITVGGIVMVSQV